MDIFIHIFIHMATDEQIWKEQADRLEQLMNHFKIRSVRAFALEIGMNPSQLNKICRGEQGLPYNRALSISEAYNVPTEWLLSGKGDAPIWTNVPREKSENVDILPLKIDFKQSDSAEIIRRIRLEFDLSQQALAQRIGITKDLLLKIEHGKRNVTLLTWVLLAHYLNNKLTQDEFKRVKQIVDDVSANGGTGFAEEDDDDYKSRSSADAVKLEKQIAFLQDIIDTQKTLLDQKDMIIKQLQTFQKLPS